jgi:signal transduction histidine kinase/CheY-like chemotaxis protein
MASKPNVAGVLGALCAVAFALLPGYANAARSAPEVAVAYPEQESISLSLLRDGQELRFAPRSQWLQLRPGDGQLGVAMDGGAQDAPRLRRYRTWLVGHDVDWVHMDVSGQRLFPVLPPGSYRLRTAVAAPRGDWSELAPVLVTVRAPWWHDQGALALAGLAALGLLGAWAVGQRRRVRRREAWRLVQARRSLAEEHSAAKSRFLATLGHELRTPMTGVLGMAELLEDTALDAGQRAKVHAIQQAGRHLLRLVNDALDLARIEAGKLVLDDAAFELRPLLQEVAGLLRPMAAAKGLGFRLECETCAPAALRGDATRVRQILFNLGHNAIKFCERGEVLIAIGPHEPQGLRLVVEDDGPGLAPALEARLFRRFEQGCTSEACGSGGSGLGLAICRELAVAMGGVISAGNRPGGGARFEVRLPLPTAAPPLPPPAPRARAATPLRLLLVEDDAVVADVFIGLLRRAGHEVVHAAHGLAALAELACGRFDLALLDLDLPGLDGFALARLIRERGQALPLVAVTARADAEAEPAARAAGMAGFLRKPVEGERLLDAIHAQLGPAATG